MNRACSICGKEEVKTSWKIVDSFHVKSNTDKRLVSFLEYKNFDFCMNCGQEIIDKHNIKEVWSRKREGNNRFPTWWNEGWNAIYWFIIVEHWPETIWCI